jgi:hypothetical protein
MKNYFVFKFDSGGWLLLGTSETAPSSSRRREVTLPREFFGGITVTAVLAGSSVLYIHDKDVRAAQTAKVLSEM